MSRALGLKQLASATSHGHDQVPHLGVLWLEIDGEAMASQRFAAHRADRGDDHSPGPVDHCVREGFIRPEHRDLLRISSDFEELLEMLLRYNPPPEAPKWIDAGDR